MEGPHSNDLCCPFCVRGLVQVALASEKATAFKGRNSNNNTVHWRWLFEKQKANIDSDVLCEFMMYYK